MDQHISTLMEYIDSTPSSEVNDVYTSPTDSGPESDNSEDPDMGISVTNPLIDQSDSSYIVTCTVNIAIAIPKVEDEESLSMSEKKKKGQKKEPSNEVVEAPRAEGYYCIEYNMFPDEPEPTKVDLVMFGLAAKVYMANETKVLKPWQEGNQVWVGWSQTFNRNVTKELLIKMTSHKITVKVWDSKDKISFRARNDRPKAFRLPQERSGEDPDEMVGIMKMVCKLRAMYEKENPRTRTSMKHHTGPVANYCKKHSGPGCETEFILFQKQIMENTEFLEVTQQKEAASLDLSLASLLAGSMTLTDCLEHCSGGVNEGFLNITLDQPLMSNELKSELNPLVITVLYASSLPSSPVPFHILKEKCLPVYCRYKFHNMPFYRTKGQDHNANIYFKDMNVIFTGLLNTGQLCEFLRGPPLEIEVHDRDRKLEKRSKPPAVFDPSDFRLASVDLGITKWTESKLHDPCGIAKLDLSNFLTGCRYLKTKLPIGCSNCALDELEMTKLQISCFEVPSDTPMPMGHYIQADSHLKVKVEIAYPLNPGDAKSEDCPFGRIIYIFKYSNAPVLAKLTSEILQVNSEAFQLDSYPEETIERVLSGHKMSAKDRENKTRNVLTGFHMMDKALHVLVLEGLKDQAVKRLWTKVPMKLDGDEEEQVTVLYNSDLSFSERLYDTLDVGLSPIYLLKPLETIMGEPLLFIRNMVPYGCLEAIKRRNLKGIVHTLKDILKNVGNQTNPCIHVYCMDTKPIQVSGTAIVRITTFFKISEISHLCHAKKISEAVHHNLFPSADMVLSLSKQFGLVLGRGQLKLVMETQKPQDIPDHQNIKKRIHMPLDDVNKEYFQWKQQQGTNVKDFIQANIEDVHRASTEVQKSKPITLVDNVDDGQPTHSHNVQSMDSAQRDKLLLRDMISIYIPFTYPGFKSSVESNQHPKRPDDARIEELRKPWRENILHGSTLKPTLSRLRPPWMQRHQDFELYSKPQFVFPVSIHLAGETRHKEQLQAAQTQYNRWMSKMLLDETAKASRRVPEFKCHMKRADLGKLEDILKDKPMKYSLRRPGMILKPIPVTSVVQCADPADSVEKEANIPFAPGPFQNHSLCWDKNSIPRHTSHYSKYHFRDCWRPHSFLHKRGALPLTEDERRIHSTQKPADTPETRMITAHFKQSGNIIEMRTNKDITLHVH